MFEFLQKINRRPKPYQFYTADRLWTDPYISKKMLQYHLDNSTEAASRNPDFIDKSVNWMKENFNIGRGVKICDFGCGPGLYTTRFAELGADITGIDFSKRSIDYAKKSAAEKGLDIKYINQNYLEFETDDKFDLITMIYCDFCALSPEQRKVILGKFRNLLKDDGFVLLDVFSAVFFDLQEEKISYEHSASDGFWSDKPYYLFLSRFLYNDIKLFLDKYTVCQKDNTWDIYNWLQCYDINTINSEFATNGLKIIESYSNVAGDKLESNALEIAVVAQKAG